MPITQEVCPPVSANAVLFPSPSPDMAPVVAMVYAEEDTAVGAQGAVLRTAAAGGEGRSHLAEAGHDDIHHHHRLLQALQVADAPDQPVAVEYLQMSAPRASPSCLATSLRKSCRRFCC